MKNLLLLALFFQCVNSTLIGQTTCNISVNTSTIINPKSSNLLGVSYDGRSSMDFDPSPGVNAIGYHNPSNGAIITELQPVFNRIKIGGARYPGNLVSYNWNWSYTIGPFSGRTAQQISTATSLNQKLQFGFDEFMAMTATKGIPSSEVQIMINIYPSQGQSNPAILAADWVEYCNALNDGSNPRGGTDWAYLRAMYGHHAPYNIKMWNIGNEPWTNSEFGSTTTGANNYMAVASPIIDSMLTVDSTLHITIPLVGNSGSAWNAQIMNPNAPIPLLGRIYGVSPHSFYDNDPSTGNPNPAQVLSSFSNIANTANSMGIKVVVGDHAHEAPASDPDKGMRWEGALATGDALLGFSQISNIELANFWIYGNTATTWHPIRKNANGTYTMMATAQLYESFFSYFYDNSLQTNITNSVGGGSVLNTRASSFQTADQSRISVFIINTDLSTDNEVIPPAFNGYTLQTAKILTAPSINTDTFNVQVVSALPNGHFLSPRISVLILDYSATILSVEYIDPLQAYPVEDGIEVVWATATEFNCEKFEVERSNSSLVFENIQTVKGNGNSNTYHLYKIKDTRPYNGANYYRIKEIDYDGHYQYSKIINAHFEHFKVNVYPNPLTGVMYLDSNEPIEKVDIMNAMGAVVESIYSPQHVMDLTELPNGIYFIKIYSNNYQSYTQKMYKK